MRTPVELLNALALSAAVDLDSLANRQSAYSYVHVGTQPLPIGRLREVLHQEADLAPPRTGHLGNWEDIALGRAGAMDFNQAICASGVGYPLITCFTQTEADDGVARSGDWVYLPGSIVERGKREILPLFTWDGSGFAQRSRERPLFCPFVQTEHDGARLPLIELHWQRMQAIEGFQFRHEAQAIVDHQEIVRPMLALLLEEATHQENQRRALSDLISHAVAPDGTVNRAEIARDGNGYWLGDCFYASTDALVEHALIPFRAVTEPRRFFEDVGQLPARVPVLSHLVIGILSAILTTHYPDLQDRTAVTRPFNPHFHWGARDMAGFPPRRNGYFVERSTTRSLRRMCAALLAHFPEVDPVCIVLLPAAAFMLCPSSAHPLDAELLNCLFARLGTDDGSLPADRLQQAIEGITTSWLEHNADALSPYFVNRFWPRRGVMHVGDLPASGAPIVPHGFDELTFRQACMVVGALYEAAA
jgi:Family of unknown function (DUF6025)